MRRLLGSTLFALIIETSIKHGTCNNKSESDNSSIGNCPVQRIMVEDSTCVKPEICYMSYDIVKLINKYAD